MSVVSLRANLLVLSILSWSTGAAVSAEAPDKQATPPAAAPMRVQIVPPDAGLVDAIQAERDKLPEPASPFLIRKLEGHTGPVSGVAFSPDGNSVVSCSGWPVGDRTIRLWDVASGKERLRLDTGTAAPEPGLSGRREAAGEFYCVAFTPDGNQVLAGSSGGVLRVWDAKTGKVIRQLEGHTATVYGIGMSPNGRHALTAGRDMTARLWDLRTGREIIRLDNPSSWIRSVAVTPDGLRALTGSYDHAVRLWDLKSGKELKKFPGHSGWVWSVALSPDSPQALAAGGDNVRLWDLESGREVRRYRGHHAPVTCVSMTPDGRRFLSSSYDRTVRVWDIESGRSLGMFVGHRDWVFSVAASPDGLTAVSGGGGRSSPTGDTLPGIDFALRLWKLP